MAFLLDVIVPLFLLIGCGYLLGRRRSIDPAPLADVAIYICLPFLMFAALVRHPVTGAAAAQAFAWQAGMYVVSNAGHRARRTFRWLGQTHSQRGYALSSHGQYRPRMASP